MCVCRERVWHWIYLSKNKREKKTACWGNIWERARLSCFNISPSCSLSLSLSLSLSSTFIIRIFSTYLCVELMNHQHNSPHFLFILIKQSCMFLLQSPVPTYKINGVSHKHIFAFSSIALMYTSACLRDRERERLRKRTKIVFPIFSSIQILLSYTMSQLKKKKKKKKLRVVSQMTNCTPCIYSMHYVHNLVYK